MSRRMIAAGAIAIMICCAFVCVFIARAEERGVAPRAETARSAPAGLSAKARLRLDGKGAGPMEIDVIAALGRTAGEPELRDLLAALRIEAKPAVKRGDVTAFLQNRKLGVELTFGYAEGLDVPLRDYPPGALVLRNIRFYGPGSSTHEAFAGDLPFGLRFGDTRAALIAKFGPPDADGTDIPPMRWDTARYALHAQLGKDDRLMRLSLQMPYVASNRPGFEER
jgi:hypothetical protein